MGKISVVKINKLKIYGWTDRKHFFKIHIKQLKIIKKIGNFPWNVK